MARRSTSTTANSFDRARDVKWRECDHVLAIRARRYHADEIPARRP